MIKQWSVIRRPTALPIRRRRTHIDALEGKGFLRRGKVGKAFVYNPASDLAGKLGF
jgi:hypothetical protein